MSNHLLSGIIALGAGGLLGILLFVPFVARVYRRRGRLTAGMFLLWSAALVYFWAIWTYTLLPLPDGPIEYCAGAILNPMDAVHDVQKAIGEGGNVLLSAAVLQLALNVLLFVPLGFFIRVLAGRGIVLAATVGFAVSLFIELTQLTGVWGIYACAYRFFDVSDLITNTAGAFMGAVIGLVIPARLRGGKELPGADQPRPVTRGRRLLAMVCDALSFWVIGAGAAVVMQLAFSLFSGGRPTEQQTLISSTVANLLPLVIWTVLILATGRSVGDHSVQLAYRGAGKEFPARVLRLLSGISGAALLALIPGAGELLSGAFWVVTFVLTFTTDGRGLPGLLLGRPLVDAREPDSLPAGPRSRNRAGSAQ